MKKKWERKKQAEENTFTATVFVGSCREFKDKFMVAPSSPKTVLQEYCIVCRNKISTFFQGLAISALCDLTRKLSVNLTCIKTKMIVVGLRYLTFQYLILVKFTLQCNLICQKLQLYSITAYSAKVLAIFSQYVCSWCLLNGFLVR